jgi:hypothetical protein
VTARPSRASLVAGLLVVALLGYAAVAVALRWWPSAVVAPVIAVMLWRRTARARFAAYVFFSVLAARGALTGVWALPAFALAALALMQTRAAARAWPRLTRRRADGAAGDDRMREP